MKLYSQKRLCTSKPLRLQVSDQCKKAKGRKEAGEKFKKRSRWRSICFMRPPASLLTFRSRWTTPIWWQWRTASRICWMQWLHADTRGRGLVTLTHIHARTHAQHWERESLTSEVKNKTIKTDMSFTTSVLDVNKHQWLYCESSDIFQHFHLFDISTLIICSEMFCSLFLHKGSIIWIAIVAK